MKYIEALKAHGSATSAAQTSSDTRKRVIRLFHFDFIYKASNVSLIYKYRIDLAIVIYSIHWKIRLIYEWNCAKLVNNFASILRFIFKENKT